MGRFDYNYIGHFDIYVIIEILFYQQIPVFILITCVHHNQRFV